LKKSSAALRQMSKLIEVMRFNQLVGIRLVRTHRDGVTLDCKLRPKLLNASGVLHGRITATLADAAVGIAITQRLAPGVKVSSM